MSRYISDLASPKTISPTSTGLNPTPTRATVPQGQVLRGQYQAPLRSDKGKLKGIVLQTPAGSVDLKLPKYLRPILVREILPGSWVQVWAFPEADRWRAANLIPWPEDEVPAGLKAALAEVPVQRLEPAVEHPSRTAATATKAAPARIQVCRKGKCFKQGGSQIFQALQAEVAQNPDLHPVTIEATGCMNACKHGPNLRVLPDKKMHSRVTLDRALTVLADVHERRCQ